MEASQMGNILHYNEKLTCLDDQINDVIARIKPSWVGKTLKKTTFDGTSNSSSGYCVEGNTRDMIVFRIYGEDSQILIDRDLELLAFQLLSANQLAPNIYCTFTNGFCYGFMPGVSLTIMDLKTENILKMVACLVARIHSINTPSSFVEKSRNVGTVFDVIERYTTLVSKGSLEIKIKGQEITTISMENIRAEVSELRKVVDEHVKDAESVFCHNDINCPNLIYDKITESLGCIDYEYASINYSSYDIGNFFCEFAGGSDMVYDEHYPSKEIQLQWIKCYLEERIRLSGDAKKTEISDEKVHKLYREVNVFALASHLLWGTWALVQSEISNIQFDFTSYAMIRLEEYYKKKEEFLGLLVEKNDVISQYKNLVIL